MTASTPSMTSRQNAPSRTSPSINSTPPRTASRFSRFPVKKLSSTRTCFPFFRSVSTTCEPIKPAPPVTRYRVIVFLFPRSTLLRSVCELLQLAKGDSLEPRRRDCLADRWTDQCFEFPFMPLGRHGAINFRTAARCGMEIHLRDAFRQISSHLQHEINIHLS